MNETVHGEGRREKDGLGCCEGRGGVGKNGGGGMK